MPQIVELFVKLLQELQSKTCKAVYNTRRIVELSILPLIYLSKPLRKKIRHTVSQGYN